MSNRSDRITFRSTGRTIAVNHPISTRQLQQLVPSELNELVAHCERLAYSGSVTQAQVSMLRATVDNVYSTNNSQMNGTHGDRQAGRRDWGYRVRFPDTRDDWFHQEAPRPPQRTSMATPGSRGYTPAYDPYGYFGGSGRSSRRGHGYEQDMRDAEDYIRATRSHGAHSRRSSDTPRNHGMGASYHSHQHDDRSGRRHGGHRSSRSHNPGRTGGGYYWDPAGYYY
ncbi:hypothetical protein ACN47E_006480 [Coniothyrium glycines]